MMIEQLKELNVKPNKFTGYFFVPDSTQITNNLNTTGFFSLRFESTDQSVFRTIFLKSDNEQSLKIGFISIEDVNQKLNQIHDFFDQLFIQTDFKIQSLRNQVEIFAQSNQLIISSAFLSCESEQQEEDSNIALFDVLMCGLPPLVMFEEGRFHFPVRSGIPLGVNDLLMKSQILEMGTNATFYLHSQLNSNYELKELHTLLKDIDIQKLPNDILLFELQLSEIKG